MMCPNCGSQNLSLQTVDETLTYAGQSLTLHGMELMQCQHCEEGVWSEASYRRYTEAQTALLRSVKGNVSEEIRRIRKKLKLTQTELAAKFGVGKVAFSRYERGETNPPAPVVKLLRLVDKHPELLAEI